MKFNNHFINSMAAVVGCEDIKPPSRDARVMRQGDVTTVVCADQSGETWQVTCRDNTWSGEIGNCSSPSSVAGAGKILCRLVSVSFSSDYMQATGDRNSSQRLLLNLTRFGTEAVSLGDVYQQMQCNKAENKLHARRWISDAGHGFDNQHVTIVIYYAETANRTMQKSIWVHFSLKV